MRWVMDSKQGRRYIKCKMGDQSRNKILEHNGIRLSSENLRPSVRTCGRWNDVNRLESKYCEKTGCNYPLTQEAFDEIKKAEEEKIQSLIAESNKEKGQRDTIIEGTNGNTCKTCIPFE